MRKCPRRKLGVGDRVKTVKKIDWWDWAADMDNLIGREGTIKEKFPRDREGRHSYAVAIEGARSWYWPEESLQRIQ